MGTYHKEAVSGKDRIESPGDVRQMKTKWRAAFG